MLSKLQWRCLFTFCLPLVFLVVFFALNYGLIFYHLLQVDSEEVVFSALSVAGMEILWGYFPIMGGFIFVTNKERRRTDAILANLSLMRLVPREKRFYYLVLPALISLCPITVGKNILRFNCPDCFSFWVVGLLLEFNWLYLQGINIYCWIKDYWRDEADSAREKGELFSRKQERCILGFILPFSLLLLLVMLYRVLEYYGVSNERLAFISLPIDLLFVFGPAMGTYSWMTDNWSREKREGERFKRFLKRSQ